MNNARGSGLKKKKGKCNLNNLNPNAYLIKLVNPQMHISCDGERKVRNSRLVWYVCLNNSSFFLEICVGVKVCENTCNIV